MKQTIFVCTLLLVISSCKTSQPALQFNSTEDKYYESNVPPLTQSLFADKNSTISEENIQKILNGEYKIPQTLRVAIVKVEGSMAHNRFSWNDEQYLKTQQAYLDLFIEKLKQSARVISASAIPDLLLSKPATFTNVREAAVRLQADLVLVYSISADVYSKYKIFTKPDIKAFATTQLILLDVRTGLIPFSTTVTKDLLSKRQETELDNNEASNRIQKEAVLMTIDEIGNKMLFYLAQK